MSDLATVEAEDLDGDLVVRVVGEVDLSNAREVLDAIARLVPEEVRRVAVDLGGVVYLDSAAISMIFRLADTLTRRRQELRLVVPEESPIRVVLELTSVPTVVPVVGALAEVTRRG